MGKTREAAIIWYKEKEGFIALFCLFYWAVFTTYILFHFATGTVDPLLLDFYRSFTQLPLVVMGGVFGVKVAQDFGKERNKGHDYGERV